MFLYWEIVKKLYQIMDLWIYYKFFSWDEAALRHKIQKLGVVFIKLAQWCASFSSIMDPHNKLFKTLVSFQSQCEWESDFSLHDEFIENNIVSIIPYASGSIGMIFLGKWKKEDEKPVIIKTRHPWVAQEFEIWKHLIGFLVCWIRLFWGIRFDIQGVYQTLYEQLDFEKEAENMKEFRVMYQSDLDVLKIPEVYYARENMIVMEYIPSVSREEESEWSYPERSEIYCLMKCWVLEQIIIKNCLHGDLHNGNWGITPDRQGIVLYDFGHVFKNMALTSDFYIAMLRKQHSDVADKMMALFGLEQTPELKTQVGEILERYRKRDQNSVSSEFIMDILKTLHQQKKIVLNRKVAFILNLIMCFNHLHQIDMLKDPKDYMEYSYLILKRKGVLDEYCETIVYKKFILQA